MEYILLCVAEVIVLIVSITLFLKLFSSIIPRAIMRLRCKGAKTRDRGIKKYVYENGRCVVYEPDINVRKYVSKYSLFTENGYKYMQCKVNPRIHYLKYDIYVFDCADKLIDVINVNEYININEIYSAKVELPPETSYVRFVLRKVDAEYSCKKSFVGYSPMRYALCGVVVGIATALETFIVYTLLKDIMDLLKSILAILDLSTIDPEVTIMDVPLREFILMIKAKLSEDLGILDTQGAIVLGSIICVVVVTLTLLAYYRNSKRVINR